MLKILKGFIFGLLKLVIQITGFGIVLLAVVLNGAHFVVNMLPDKSQFVSAVATGILNQPVSVASVRLEGSAIHPFVALEDVAFGSQKIKTIKVGINLWQSLLAWDWVTDHVLISDVSISNQVTDSANQLQPSVVNWLMLQPDITFSRVNLNLQSRAHDLLAVKQLTIHIKNRNHNHVIGGNFLIAQHEDATVRFVLKANAKAVDDPNAHGIIYVSAKNLDISKSQSALINMLEIKKFPAINGAANAEVWAHFNHHQWQSIQSQINFLKLETKINHAKWLISPLSVHATWFPQKNKIGVMTFHSQDAKLDFGALFSHAFSNFEIQGKLAWIFQNHQWRVNLKKFALRDRFFDFNAKSILHFGDGQSPYVEFVGHTALSDVSKIGRYLPDRILKPHLNNWLQRALKKGALAQGNILFKGALDSFPFRKGNGHFEVSANLDNLALNFSNDWPTLKKLNGKLQFDGSSMELIAKSAQLANLNIKNVTANINNLSHPNLIVKASSSMDLADGVLFLKHSKLSIANDIDLLKGSGAAKATIYMQLPLYEHHAKPCVKGHVSFFHNKLVIPKWSIILNGLTGNLDFDNNALSSHGLHALLFDEPFHIKLQNKNDNQGKKSLAINADGKVNITKLKTHFLKRPFDIVNGTTDIHVKMLLHDIASPLKNTVTVDSNLQGIRVARVPNIFLKNKNEKWRSKVKVVMHRDGHINFSADIFSQLSSRFLLLHDQSGLHFLSGQISLGKNPAILPKKQGLFITGSLPVVNLSEWEDWYKKTYPDSNVFKKKQALPSFLGGVDLSIDDLIANDQHWRDLFLSIAPLKNGTSIQVQNADVSGKIILPFFKNKMIMGDFDYLFLPASISNGKASVKKIDPVNLPPLNIHIADFRVKGIRIGDVNLATNPMHDGLKFKKIQVDSALIHLDAHGRWIKLKNNAYTDLEGKFDSVDLGAFLLQRNISSRLKGGVLTSQFSLNWQGSPSDFVLKNTNGSLSLHLTSGRILKLDHETESGLEFGRFLNLLSLASVSKYLTFNFSSMTSKGFPFDKLTGDLTLKKGDIDTKNIEIDGPLAHVRISGKIGLTSEKNDLYLLIYPYISSSLPVIVGLAGGPIAGVATWLVNKIVEPGFGHMMKMRYHVTGSWQHLSVNSFAS